MKKEKKEELTYEDKCRSVEIMRMVEQLPESEQEKIYYMLKGIELMESRTKT